MFKKHRRFLFFIGLVLPLSFVLICNSILITLTGGNSRSSNWEGNAMSILRVAENELGTVGGSKYREWYIGAADGAEWCATFVSWCANEVGLLDTVIPKFQSCSVGISQMKEMGIWEGINYRPVAGDIIFFDWDPENSNGPDHVGFVWSISGNEIITIEGNSSNAVESNHYDFYSKNIYGYAHPHYPQNGLDGVELTEDQIYYLAQLVWCEAGSTWLSDHVQQMCASVVINRINSSLYPDTLEEVIAQPGQYQPYIDGSIFDAVPDDRTIANVRYVVQNGPVCPPYVLAQHGFADQTYDGIYETYEDPSGI